MKDNSNDKEKAGAPRVIQQAKTSEKLEKMREKLDQMGQALLREGKSLNDPALLKQANMVTSVLNEDALDELDIKAEKAPSEPAKKE